MHILALGLNHQSAPVELRELLALGDEQLPDALAAIRAETREAVIVATCNRTEVYAVTAHTGSGARALRRFLAARTTGLEAGALDAHLYEHVDEAAVRHLLRVAAGLDSLVIGEPQILGQVRDALAAARAAGAVGPILSSLFRAALAAGKEARATTGIARHTASIGHAAIELARRELGGLAGRSVLVIGAGKMATLTARALLAATPKDAPPPTVTIVNRTATHAAELAATLGGTARPFTALGEALAACDVAIASTGAPTPVLTRDLLAPVLPRRNGRLLLLLDIAVPRDVESAVATLPGVRLYDIDDLRETVTAGLAARSGEIEKVEAVLERHTASFWAWHTARAVAPTVTALRARAETIRVAELAKTLGRLGHLSERDRNAVAALSVAITNKLLHEPTMRLKHPEDGSDFVRAAHELFGLVPADQPDAAATPQPAVERSATESVDDAAAW